LKYRCFSSTVDWWVEAVINATLMGTINDFLAYRMGSSWRTHGKLACPYYMKNNKAFTLTNDGKISFVTAINDFFQRIIG
jgi:hypothetical protein